MENQNQIHKDFDNLESNLLRYAKNILTNSDYPQESYPIELCMIGLINRSLSLLYGFKTLLGSQNYIAAIHLVRPHLDNLLRFNAVWLVDEPQVFCKQILLGVNFTKLKSKTNEQLNDRYLKNEAQKKYTWIAQVYGKTSGFIHFSNSFITTSSKLTDTTIETKISKYDKYVPEEARIESIKCMIEIAKCLFSLFDEWFLIKENKEAVSSNWLIK
jgi:hypothetical protein